MERRTTREAGVALGALVTLVIMAACGSGGRSVSQQSPKPSASASAAPTLEEVLAVANALWSGNNQNPCQAATIANCPVTKKLATRVKQIEQAGSGNSASNSWCRCQSVGNVQIVPTVNAGVGVAHFTFDASIKVDFIMVEEGDKLLIDDTQCSGRGAGTSIYVQPLVSCG